MNHIKSDSSVRFQNSSACTAFEYEFNDENDINNAVIELSGRYPEAGFAVNLICKEIIYIIEGEGYVYTTDDARYLEAGDMIRLNSKERYYFDGKMKLLISSTPAWRPEQYQNVK
jgi:mannose-6-phosphate isomerase-like protein (cupin superfamily)